MCDEAIRHFDGWPGRSHRAGFCLRKRHGGHFFWCRFGCVPLADRAGGIALTIVHGDNVFVKGVRLLFDGVVHRLTLGIDAPRRSNSLEASFCVGGVGQFGLRLVEGACPYTVTLEYPVWFLRGGPCDAQRLQILGADDRRLHASRAVGQRGTLDN